MFSERRTPLQRQIDTGPDTVDTAAASQPYSSRRVIEDILADTGSHPHDPAPDGHAHDGHAHDHGAHAHDEHTEPPSPVALRVKALESLLVEKGVVERAALDELIDAYEARIGPRNGVRVVARAWTDPDFRRRLLEDATAAIDEVGVGGPKGEHLVAVENTPEVHNLVVCTLCSCYPWPVLGLPPTWYKSAPYRSRAVRDPRGVLREFGTQIAEDVEVRVWDSTSEVRYLVVPMRPDGTDGWTAEALEPLITRNSMVGVEVARSPEGAA